MDITFLAYGISAIGFGVFSLAQAFTPGKETVI
jgi:hypothetical protein